ncbi:hypothetical protein [Rothia aeria]|uniref:hypothetical protein n=1 Tax=Rothia aeria TaxID=172042 RepID=UPI0028E8649B|nr:hypothetical protein [Rothia aeria]
MSSDYSILQREVLDFPESVTTVSQVLSTYVREVEAGSGEDFVQVTAEEYGRLNIFRALVEFDTPGHLRLLRTGCGVDDNFLAPLSSFQDAATIAGLASLHGADNTRRILYAAARGFGGLYLITGEVLEDESEHDHRMQDTYAATAHLV